MASRHNAGFTLLELMVIVAITSILLTYAIPGISRTLAHRRAGGAASELADILQRAQNLAMEGEPAHAVVIQPGFGAATSGRVAMLRGTSARCGRQNWLAALNACPAPRVTPPGTIPPCVTVVDFNGDRWNRIPWEMRFREVPLNQERDARPSLLAAPAMQDLTLCFESGGATLWARGAVSATMTFQGSIDPAVGGGFVFAFASLNPNPLETTYRLSGVPRVVLMPFGGTPRRVR